MSLTSRSRHKTTLLMGSSAVPRKVQAKMSFLADLRQEDLEKLRIIVRRVHLKYYTRPLGDYEVDRFIESLGPRVREQVLLQHLKAFSG